MKVLLSKEELHDGVGAMAQQIEQAFEGRQLTIVEAGARLASKACGEVPTQDSEGVRVGGRVQIEGVRAKVERCLW